MTYTIEICNDDGVTLNRDSVTDSLLGDIAALFPATLAPGACAEAEVERTVLDTDPDPLVNTVTATYSGARLVGDGHGQCHHGAVPAGCRCHQGLHA